MENTILASVGNQCLVGTLINLKESSLNAVESSKSLGQLNKYMHVTRPAQEEFERILVSASKSEKAELILLCGSVGDGKSHLLSYCNDRFPEIMEKFQVHNDSTASFYKEKPAIYTLKEIMKDFTDNRIELHKNKLILAINLGTLNNFIEADTDGEFSLLKQYISNENILTGFIGESKNDITSHFHCVNFSDYHIYSLAEEVPQSLYIDSLIMKLVAEGKDNPFFQAYVECCTECPSAKVCPVKSNYEMLKNKIYRDELLQLLIESIVKNKLIISTRTILNLIYELVVDERYIKVGSVEPRKEIEKLSALNYSKTLMPNSMFSRKESSSAINSLQSIDPINVRNEKVDSFIVEFTNKDNILEIFHDGLPEAAPYLVKFRNVNFTEYSSTPLKKELLKLFIRFYRLYNKNQYFETQDTKYQYFMKNLYYWNKGDKINLRNMILLVKQGMFLWNGDIEDDKMIVSVGNMQVKYAISQKVSIKQSLENITNKEDVINEKFSETMCLEFESTSRKEKFIIEVDLALFDLLSRIVNGYRPNMKDKELNVKLANFVASIAKTGGKDETLYIQERVFNNSMNYKLEFSEDFGYIFEVV